ncbi:hypothetical protein BDZ85DRAFT_277505 [Elsinoe ampelina]|uniref:FAD-binding domain-containing protein n=1 Tax=Elsinoe ampelina TaxID=302913 RepID=A0A6A6GQ44_9PEZI|nr:hypothetical protein BDZ85DRAFT_277505 [Elsinoe ampelina]
MGATSKSSEVLIVGAGPVGLFAAVRLGQAGIQTTFIEKESEISQLPRACMYYPQVQFVLQDAGIWTNIVEGGGFRTTGLDIRLPPVSDDQGRKKPGELVANFPGEPNFDPQVDAYGSPVQPPSMSMLDMPQPLLRKVLLEKAIETGNVESKLWIQSGETDDWFFRALKDTSSPSFANYVHGLQNVWPTHVRQMAASLPAATSAA